jgi:hypothetical protein
MAHKLKLLEIVKAHDAENKETLHMWVQELKPRRFKVNLSKASASELNTIMQNVGGVLLMDMGEMVNNGAFMMFFKPGGDIDVLESAPKDETKLEDKKTLFNVASANKSATS